jgi:hypothetical protein
MMMLASNNTLMAKRKKNKWLEKQQKHSILAIISKNKLLSMILSPKLCLEKELLELSYLWKKKIQKNCLL